MYFQEGLKLWKRVLEIDKSLVKNLLESNVVTRSRRSSEDEFKQGIEVTYKTKFGIYIPAMILDSKFQPGNPITKYKIKLFNEIIEDNVPADKLRIPGLVL